MNKLLNFFKLGNFKFIHSSAPLRKVLHNEEEKKFILNLPSSKKVAFVRYEKQNGVLDLKTLLVPIGFRKLGLGQLLAQEVLHYCIKNQIKVKLSCPFIIKFVKDNPRPEYKEIIVE